MHFHFNVWWWYVRGCTERHFCSALSSSNPPFHARGEYPSTMIWIQCVVLVHLAHKYYSPHSRLAHFVFTCLYLGQYLEWKHGNQGWGSKSSSYHWLLCPPEWLWKRIGRINAGCLWTLQNEYCQLCCHWLLSWRLVRYIPRLYSIFSCSWNLPVLVAIFHSISSSLVVSSCNKLLILMKGGRVHAYLNAIL